ncbi:extracellular solute-binding protein [Spiribacter sp. 1M153]|uniref:extracellular solute-binding protein n=1 Tax=Spiribacter roseus TaxID=1855875 RepID=UPI00349F5943
MLSFDAVRLTLRAIALGSLIGMGQALAAEAEHALALHGEPRYGPGFEHFDYVNPQAPKGGTLKLANVAASTFDSLHPFILRGTAAEGMGRVFDTLTVQSLDEPFTQYGLIARSIEVADDHSSVRFNLRDTARFHDGEPITADDVAWTFRRLREDGHPRYRAYYADVDRVEVIDPLTVEFHFATTDNAELPLILGQLPVLPAHDWAERDFTATTLTPPLGSGPYRVASVEQGRRIVYERVDDYWAADLPVNRGRYNFDRISYDYYRDGTVALQALKAGEYHLRRENVARNWATAYDTPAVEAGLLKRVEIPHDRPAGMQGFFFNTRRAVFADPAVREALAYAFDFEWTNENLFYGAYDRTRSYFQNSELAATGLPSEAELELLEPYRDQLPERVFTEAYAPPDTTDGSRRANLRRALALLRDAGWAVRDGTLTHTESGEPMAFEILLVSPSFERVVLPFKRNLERLGAEVSVRTVDPTQYQNRMEAFDFDMTVHVAPQSLSPGNEQRDFWSCEAAEITGSRNVAGVCDPVIDELVTAVIDAPDREALVTRTRALDRVLQWHFYAIPNWYIDRFRLAYWDRFGRPADNPPYGLALDSWWVDPERAARVDDR